MSIATRSSPTEIAQRWEIEHEQIRILAKQVLKKSSENEPEATHRVLEALALLIKEHFRDEHLTLLEISRDDTLLDPELQESVETFRESFQGLQRTLLHKILSYSRLKQDPDEEFLRDFSILVEHLDERFRFEEETLYPLLKTR